MLIEVQEMHPPKAGGKVAHVVAKDGQKFEIWPDKLGGIQVGHRYDAEIEDREYNGRTFRKITKVTPVNGNAHSVNGNAHSVNGNGQSVNQSGSNGEAEYVGRALHALILKGEVTFNERHLGEATAMLCRIWERRRQ